MTAPPAGANSAGELLMVEVLGDFDLAVADRLRQPLVESIPDNRPLVAFDLCDCTHVDTVALGLIMDANSIARDRSGAAALICPDGGHPALAPLRMSSLEDVIQLFPSRELFSAFMETLDGLPVTEVMRVSESQPPARAGSPLA